jgi:ABC-type bacteriocin/lantibiotic exporter with double-glycine peptidase domain
MTEGVAGFSASEALRCLLRLLGREGRLASFPEDHAEARVADSLETLVSLLGREGHPARPVQIQEGDLAFLHLPTLAQHRDRSWLVVKARTRSGYLVLGAAGPVAIPRPGLDRMLSGQALDLSPGLPREGGLWSRLRALLGHHREVLAAIVAATVAIQLLGLVTPTLTAVVMNRALPDGAAHLLALVAAGVALMAIFHAWTAYVRGRALLYLTQRMDLMAGRGLLEHILGLAYPQLRSRALGEWLQAFSGFAAARGLLTEATLGALLDGVLALVLLGAMAWLQPGPAALVAAATLVMAAATLLAGRAEIRLQALQVEVLIKEQGYLTELLDGIATLKAAGWEGACLRRWRFLHRKGLGLALQKGRIALWAGTGMGVLVRMVAGGLLVWGGLQVVKGSLGLGTFLAFLQLASAFLAASLGLVATYLSLRILGPQLARAAEILALPREPGRDLCPPSKAPATIALRKVWFRYRPEGPWVLRGYDLNLEAGAKWHLSEPSGWGKSTILRLLAGLEEPGQGEVLIGGRAPREVRHKLIYLPQFVQLYAGSILDNLRVLSGGAPTDALLCAAAATGLDEFLATLPMGLKTILPHGGRTLSGGQRQWVALTAAMAAGRGVLLLDEPLANLDAVVAVRLRSALASGDWTLVTAGHEGAGRP